MARKRQEIQLQVEIETQEEWEDMLAKEGLCVVDVYQEWCGPCKAMVANLKRLKNEVGDDLLRFYVAKADTIDALERYRGRCQPCFLFYGGGMLVNVIRGANTPTILRSVTDELAKEHKVLEGEQERQEIRDPMFAHLDEMERKAEAEDEEEEVPNAPEIASEAAVVAIATSATKPKEHVQKEVTVAIIKPDVVQAGKVDEVIEKMQESGIEVLTHEERLLTDEEAREFYAHKQEEEYYEELIKFMTSGPSHVLVLTKGDTGGNIIEEWRELIGPPNVEEAKESAPESLRAQYGTESFTNALHGSDSQDRAMRELAFFFPDYVIPTAAVPSSKTKKQKKRKAPKMQRTLALIRPDALEQHKDAILAKIEEAGFRVALQKEIQLSREQAEEFYQEHKDEEYFEELMNRMTCGPLLALGLAREDAVTGWRGLLGPKEVAKALEEEPESLRAQFAVENVPFNPLHGSDSIENAEKELDFFFGPMQQTVAVIKPDAYQTKDEIMETIKEAGFNIVASKETELNTEMVEQFYEDCKEKEYFNDLIEHMTSGPTLVMVLSKENAIEGWRSLIGPTDPEVAKQENPDSLRAKYGKDVKANALHGASNLEQAQTRIKTIFGDIQFTRDGEESEDEEEREEDQPEEGQTEAEQKEGEGEENTEETEEGGEQKDEQQEGEPTEGAEEQQGEQTEGGETKPEEEEKGEGEQPTEGQTEQEEDKKEDETQGDETQGNETQVGNEEKPSEENQETEAAQEGGGEIQNEGETEQAAVDQTESTDQEPKTDEDKKDDGEVKQEDEQKGEDSQQKEGEKTETADGKTTTEGGGEQT